MGLTARDAGLIVAAAIGLAAGLYGLSRGLREPPAPARHDQVDAAALYARYCVVCHGPAGKGDGPGANVVRQNMPDFSDPVTMRKVDDGFLFTITQKGGSQLGRSNAMPAWGMKLTDDEIRALVRYLRGLARPAAPAASPPRKDAP